MKFLEMDLEEIIFNADKELLAERGLRVYGTLYRQLRIGNYGIADLVTINRPRYIEHMQAHVDPWFITVYELKKDKAGMSAFLQAVGYAKGIKRYLESRGIKEIEIKIVLIGSRVDEKSTLVYLPTLIQETGYGAFLEFYTYRYELNGIFFKDAYGYKLANEGF